MPRALIYIVLRNHQTADSEIESVHRTERGANLARAKAEHAATSDGYVVEGVNDSDGDDLWELSFCVQPHEVQP